MEVGKHQFGIDHVGIGQRIDMAGDLGDLFAFETAQDMGDGGYFADMAEKLVAQAFAAARAGDQPGDVEKFKLGRYDFLRFRQSGDNLQPVVGHGDPAGIRLHRTERIIGGFGGGGCGQRIEQGRFTYVRQADNSALKSHQSFPCQSGAVWPGGGAR